MKKTASNWIVVLIAILCVSALQTDAQTVYITRTGEKYHQGSCRYLRQSKIETTVEKAIANGYSACSVCRPSGTKTEVPSSGGIRSTPSSTKTVASSSQCTAYTKSGARCRRTASANGRCWQH